MTDQLRQAAQQALEALENSSPDQYPEDAGVFYDAITALKAALEQQAEPVAKLFGSLPVYDTAPPQRKELSAREILNMMPSGIPAEYDGELMEFARAVEAKLKEGT